ncbi:MAG TPA: hypothetical protein VF407_02100 [Polyangiaceae bacterium]
MAVTRVGLMRTVLGAHFTASKNRVRRELGRFGSFVMAIVVVVLGLGLAVPMLLSFGALGFVFAHSTESVAAVPLLSILLGGIAVGGGILSGISGGAKQLTWESYRVYPTRFSTLFFAEIIAGLGDLFPAAFGASTLAVLVGVGIATPRALFVAPLVLVEGLASGILIQLLVSSLASVLVRRIRVAFFLLFFTPVAMGAWVDSIHPSPATMAELQKAALFLGRVLEMSPIGMATRSLAVAADGRLVDAYLLHLAPLASVSLLAWVTSKVILIDLEPAAHDDGPGGKLWSFDKVDAGIAKLSWHTIMGSQIGRFGFIVPLFSIVLIRGPLAQLIGRGAWNVPAAFMYVSLSASSLQLNQFGLDGHGVKCLFFMPIKLEDILRGKTRGLFLYQGSQALVLALLLPLACKTTVNEIAAGLLLAVCFFFVQSSVGRYTSMSMPRQISRTQMRASSTPVTLVLLGLALSAGSSLVFGGAYGVALKYAPHFLVPVMGVMAAITYGIHEALAPGAVRYALARRDKLIDALG